MRKLLCLLSVFLALPVTAQAHGIVAVRSRIVVPAQTLVALPVVSVLQVQAVCSTQVLPVVQTQIIQPIVQTVALPVVQTVVANVVVADHIVLAQRTLRTPVRTALRALITRSGKQVIRQRTVIRSR